MIVYDPPDTRPTRRHHCGLPSPKESRVGAIARCDSCGQFWLQEREEGFSYWEMISDKRARKMLRSAP